MTQTAAATFHCSGCGTTQLHRIELRQSAAAELVAVYVCPGCHYEEDKLLLDLLRRPS